MPSPLGDSFFRCYGSRDSRPGLQLVTSSGLARVVLWTAFSIARLELPPMRVP